MRRSEEIYSPKNVISLVVGFMIFFWLLYQIGLFLHESSKISSEIEDIRQANLTLERDILEKKAYLDYLQTPQRIEKEAKIQMGKKLPGEKVLVFVEESIDLLPTEAKQQARQRIYTPEVPNWQKWRWVFFGERGWFSSLYDQEC